MNEEILDRLDKIERYTLLAAKNVLCLDDVSLLTGLSKSHLYKLTCNHQIPHYKPNGKQMYFDMTIPGSLSITRLSFSITGNLASSKAGML